jgi:hypothetical protein
MRDGILNPVWREGKAWYFNGETDLEIPSNPGEFSGPFSTRDLSATSSPIPGSPNLYGKSGVNGSPSAVIPENTLNNSTNLVGVSRREIKRNRIYTLDIDNGTIY